MKAMEKYKSLHLHHGVTYGLCLCCLENFLILQIDVSATEEIVFNSDILKHNDNTLPNSRRYTEQQWNKKH